MWEETRRDEACIDDDSRVAVGGLVRRWFFAERRPAQSSVRIARPLHAASSNASFPTALPDSSPLFSSTDVACLRNGSSARRI
jgi:hypothetical protein